MNTRNLNVHETTVDANLVEMWLRKDPTRWFAGALAGVFSCVVSFFIGGLLAVASKLGFFFPFKLLATILLGAGATETGNVGAVIVGAIMALVFCGFFGFVFAQFTRTNAFKSLLAMGLVWGVFTWIFIWNLFLPGFHTIEAAQVSSGAAFPVCISYGLSLSSVKFFDRAMRKSA